jgi:hypothetical protein
MTSRPDAFVGRTENQRRLTSLAAKLGQIDHPTPVQTDHLAPVEIDHLKSVQTDHLKSVQIDHLIARL